MYFRPDMIRDAKKVRPPMGAKLQTPAEGWWPLATKWGPFGPPLVAEGSPSDTLKISWRSDLIWLRYIGSKMFICLFFVCLFIDLFVFIVLIALGHPEKVPQKIMWRSYLIWLRYLGSKNVRLFAFVFCLFVYRFVCL